MSEWDGRPLSPERDGWHWLQYRGEVPEAAWWNSTQEQWLDYCDDDERRVWLHPIWKRGFIYLGPCLTPAEVAAREAAAAAVIEVAAKRLESAALRLAALGDPRAAYGLREWAMNARESLPAADALTRALAKARAEEREACALIADRRAGIRGDHGTAAAIRARGKETKA